MENSKVFIVNWPDASWKDFISIIVAVLALIGTAWSLYLTRINFIRSIRPFVWASNYGVIDHQKKTIIPIPHSVGFRVKNSPARILKLKIEIKLVDKVLFSYSEANFVRFPDENSEWSFGMGILDYDNAMNAGNDRKDNVTRTILIEYASLDGGKVYKFYLEQGFVLSNNQWQDTNSISN